MLDFLPEDKRKILLKYPFVKLFLKGKLRKDVFLRRLAEFRDDIVKKGIKKEDIAIIINLLEKEIVIFVGSHSNETTAEIIGRQVYKNLKKQGYPVQLMHDKRKRNVIESRLKRAHKKLGPLRITENIIPTDEHITQVDFNPMPYDALLPKRYPNKFFISFHNSEPESFMRGKIRAYNPKLKIVEHPMPPKNDYYCYWGDDIALAKYVENLWIIEVPAFWELREKSPFLKLLDADENTIQKYKRHNIYHRIGKVNIKKSKELGLCGKEIIETTMKGVKELIKRYLVG